jgi:N-acetyl-anhydromuramyl-L-alanine amidase AmpD
MTINYNSPLVCSIYDSNNDLNSKKPNYNNRKIDTIIDTIILHYTVLNFEDSYKIFTQGRDVSIHYVIDLDGKIYQTVNEQYKAWHSGISYWAGKHNVNENSIGIEFINPGSGDQLCFPTRFTQTPLDIDIDCTKNHFTSYQYESAISLLHDIKQRHQGNIKHIVGHSDVAPNRKLDPGIMFDWHKLAQNGLGINFKLSPTPQEEILDINENNIDEINFIKERLNKIGYQVDLTIDRFDENFANLIRAFKFHFVQDSILPYDIWSNLCSLRLEEVEAELNS